MSRRGQARRLSSPYSYWLRITVCSALPARAARRILLGGGGGAVGASPMSTMFCARNHAALGYIDLVVGHGVPLSSTRVRQHGLTPT